ncbi:exonuclease V, chloroplastic-like [Cornus florida]|uniref:exonuclease V, chloroplastic-like n=1 Tax=Cornus florida TaxID=4283 RepID=UPI0028A049EB|nr:exonuclease V, chloroplastic-like [Cornus florida]
MTESPTQSPPPHHTTTAHDDDETVPQIPIEIVSEEVMALYEAAFAATGSSLSSSTSSSSTMLSSSSLFSPTLFQRNARSIQSITLLSKRRLSDCKGTTSLVGDIEDLGGGSRGVPVPKSLLHQFRRKRGLAVTDITKTEWCEKQMEFFLNFGRPRITKAIEAGRARHIQLEEEVVKRIKVCVESKEDVWAVKFMKFILGANQLLLDGLTRELPLIGFVKGVWMVGVIDEIRMPVTENERNPILVETKTRVQATIPSEPQRRNGRLQLMCYKYLWDNLVSDHFPSRQFFESFTLNPHYILSKEIRENTSNSGFPAETLDDLVRYFRNTWCMLPPAHDQLLLRYEFQEDQSLLGEDQFAYDSDWLNGQIQCSLEFWQGERKANYTPEEERWKCKFCEFAEVCPANISRHDTPT